MVTRGWRQGVLRSCLKGTVSVCNDENFLETVSHGDCTTVQMYLMPLNCPRKEVKNGNFYIMYL